MLDTSNIAIALEAFKQAPPFALSCGSFMKVSGGSLPLLQCNHFRILF
jgi:hypothetical protein